MVLAGLNAMDSQIPTQVPPKGPFSSEALQWSWCYHGKVPVQVAHIQRDRVNDFLDGEGRVTRESETSFYIRRSKSNPGPTVSWEKIITYWCHYGPENIPARIPAAPPRKGTFPAKGKDSRPRRRKVDFNEHPRRGCGCNFTVTIYKEAPGVAVISYRERFRTFIILLNSQCISRVLILYFYVLLSYICTSILSLLIRCIVIAFQKAL
jgi:hypothetical protein